MRIGIIGAGAIGGTLAAISGVLAISESGPPDATSDLPQDHNRLAGRREGEGQAGDPHGGPGAGCEAGEGEERGGRLSRFAWLEWLCSGNALGRGKPSGNDATPDHLVHL
jgi:hypothetical protein